MTVRILIGDVLVRLAELPDDSVDCVVTSPPYWGLRDYSVAGQIGLESSLGEHLDVMVKVFREVRRVLKPTGTMWLNYGDCYATAPNGRSAADTKALGSDDRAFRDKPFSTVGPIYSHQHAPPAGGRRGGGNNPSGPVYDPSGGAPGDGKRGEDRGGGGDAVPAGRIVAGGVLKAKDLCMVPNRLAIALQEDGWWVRSEIVWGKLNPMPESITDRPATAHEKIFMLVKSGATTGYRSRDTNEWNLSPDLTERLPDPTEEEPERTINRWRACDYFYDAQAVRVEAITERRQQVGYTNPPEGGRPVQMPKVQGWATAGGRHNARQLNTIAGKAEQTAASAAKAGASSGRRMDGFNERWKHREVTPRHEGHVNHTGIEATPRGSRNLRNYEPAPLELWPIASEPFKGAHFATFPTELARRCLLAGCPEDGLVLDPFGGAGTVGLVSERMFRHAILIELNEEYVEIARKRIDKEGGIFADVTLERGEPCETIDAV